jgi:hypothetical protein
MLKFVSFMGEKRNAYRALVGKPKEKRSLRRHRHRWGDNIKMGPREIPVTGHEGP